MNESFFRVADGCLRPDMFAAAQSYARLNGLAYWMYEFAANDDQQALEHIASELGTIVQSHAKLKHLKLKYQAAVVAVVLQEIQHPITVRPWSGRVRACSAGIAQKSWSNNKLCEAVDQLIKITDQSLRDAERAIGQQILEVVDL